MALMSRMMTSMQITQDTAVATKNENMILRSALTFGLAFFGAYVK